MKFRVLLVVLVVFTVLMSACAAPAPAPTGGTTEGKPLRIAVVMPSATTDLAFSQSMWSALQTIQKDMGGTSAVEL
jgi:basic membrane lipoprotein Med (substrate-binding protein (PBP1-ABC) superfamily)